MKPEISVIIPAYNVEKTIKRCIDSIRNQTFKDIEIIVVNDGSTDETLKVLNEYSDIKIISKQNEGQGIARNVGLDAACGRYVAFVDGDDCINADMYEKMYNEAVSTGAEIVQCNILNIFENGNKKIQLPKKSGVVDITDRAEYLSEYIYNYVHSYEVCNKLILKRFLDENGLRFYDNNAVFAEDFMFNLQAVMYLKKISFIPEAMYNYYLHSGSHLRSGALIRLEKTCKMFEKYISQLPGADLKAAAERLAALIVLSYAAQAADENLSEVKKIITSSAVKGYIKTSMNYPHSGIKHKALMLAILHLPADTVIKLIKNHYYDMN